MPMAARRRLARLSSHVAAVQLEELPTKDIAGHDPHQPIHHTSLDHAATADCRLSDAQRDECLKGIAENSYCILPIKLPEAIIARANAYITDFCDDLLANPGKPHSSGAWKPLTTSAGYTQTSLVELDPVFREMLTFTPAMQLSYDCFGPMFHLGQDKWTRKYQATDASADIWHSDGPHGFPEIDGHVPFHTLRFGYFMSDTTHEGQNGTLECMAGSHRSQLSKHAQVNTVFSGAGREAQWPISLNPPNGPPEQDKGEDPSIYSDNHIVHKAPAGTIVAFQNGMWHRALPNLTDKPRTVVYFQYCPCMMHPLHRDSPYPGDLSPYSPAERWLLGEPREPNRWTIGEGDDHQRMVAYRRDSPAEGSW